MQSKCWLDVPFASKRAILCGLSTSLTVLNRGSFRNRACCPALCRLEPIRRAIRSLHSPGVLRETRQANSAGYRRHQPEGACDPDGHRERGRGYYLHQLHHQSGQRHFRNHCHCGRAICHSSRGISCHSHGFQDRSEEFPETLHRGNLHPLIRAVRIHNRGPKRNELHAGIFFTDHTALQARVHGDQFGWLAK